jgi:hypothetical protein
VYSRKRRPRAQLASTISVTKGSVTERFEVTLIAARPSRVLATENWKLDRNAGRSTPYRSNNSLPASPTRRLVSSSGVGDRSSISASNG